MKTHIHSMVACTAIAILSLNTSCTVKAADNASAEQTAEEKDKPDPRFQGIPKEHHAYIKTLEKKQPRFVASWLKLIALHREVKEASTIFGLRERRRARAKLPGLQKKIVSEQAKFFKMCDKIRAPIEKEETKLKDRAMKLSEKDGAEDDPVINKRLEELYDAAFVLSVRLKAFQALQKVITHANRSRPTDLDLIGLSSHDADVQDVVRANPGLVEARLLIKDCEADIARLQAQKAAAEKDGLRWGMAEKTKEKKAEQTLQKAVLNLERQVVRAKQPFEREAAKFKKKVDMTQKKIDDLEKRKRKTATYYDRLSEYEEELQNRLAAIEMIDNIATWQ